VPALDEDFDNSRALLRQHEDWKVEDSPAALAAFRAAGAKYRQGQEAG
jgi:hypothetical protein